MTSTSLVSSRVPEDTWVRINRPCPGSHHDVHHSRCHVLFTKTREVEFPEGVWVGGNGMEGGRGWREGGDVRAECAWGGGVQALVGFAHARIPSPNSTQMISCSSLRDYVISILYVATYIYNRRR